MNGIPGSKKYSLVALLVAFCKVVLMDIPSDSEIRRREYVEPLKNIPYSARQLQNAMVEWAINEEKERGGARTPDEIRSEVLTILAQGAVLERNFLMKMVRKNISFLGCLFSWFLKEKGLTYDELEKKFDNVYSSKNVVLNEIIESASRANPDLYKKFLDRIAGFFRPPRRQIKL